MTRSLLLLFILLGIGAFSTSAQTILDFEAAGTSTNFQYFGSTLESQLTSVIANPNASGANTSAKVLEFKKPASAQTWAGAFSNPNPSTPVNVVSSTKISVAVHFDHIGNLALKLEGSADGGDNWVQTVANTKINEWEVLTFDVTIPSIELPNKPAAGHIYNTVTLFTDFGTSPTAAQVYYIDNIKVEQVITCTTILDYESQATSTPLHHFGSTLDGQFTSSVANPNPSGINTSANVLELKKPAGAQTWAGAYTDPNPVTNVVLSAGSQIKVKFHTDHPGNLTLKLEDSPDGGENWVVTVPNTVVNQWVELSFDPALPSIELPNKPAAGHVYKRVVLFADFGTSPSIEQVYYIDDIQVCTSGAIPTADVSFKLDMSKFGGTFTKAYVSGSFNNWSGDGNELLDADGDKIYETTLKLPVGLYEYKFTLDNWAKQEELAATSTCTNTTVDGANVFTNRKLVLSGNSTVGPVCFNSCYACGDAVQIAVNLGMNGLTPDPGGVYLAGGGDFGPPGGRFKMTDPDGDGVFSIQIERQRGYSTFYDFANGACPDYSCKENIEGQPCAVPTNYNDRWLSAVQKDTVINTCYASCTTNTDCTLGTNNLPLSSGWLTLQPTVTADALQLGFATAVKGAVSIRIFDAAGKLVFTETRSDLTDRHELSVSGLQAGLYVMLVSSTDKAASARFVKQN